jgi:hypothetical protein
MLSYSHANQLIYDHIYERYSSRYADEHDFIRFVSTMQQLPTLEKKLNTKSFVLLINMNFVETKELGRTVIFCYSSKLNIDFNFQ